MPLINEGINMFKNPPFCSFIFFFCQVDIYLLKFFLLVFYFFFLFLKDCSSIGIFLLSKLTQLSVKADTGYFDLFSSFLAFNVSPQ